MSHNQDSDCTVDPATDLCAVCGVHHGEPCEHCGGRGFHRGLPETFIAREAAWAEWPGYQTPTPKDTAP